MPTLHYLFKQCILKSQVPDGPFSASNKKEKKKRWLEISLIIRQHGINIKLDKENTQNFLMLPKVIFVVFYIMKAYKRKIIETS